LKYKGKTEPRAPIALWAASIIERTGLLAHSV